MLDEEEYRIVHALRERHLRYKKGLRPERVEYSEVEDAFERFTGSRKADFFHRLAAFGDPCATCGKPLRSPQARFCIPCGATK